MDLECYLKEGSFEHFEQLYEIYMQPNVNRFLNFEIMDKEQFRGIFEELINSGQLYIYMNFQNQIVATAIAVRQKRRVQHVATITTLATHSKFQGQGVGSRFMKELMNALENKGIKRVDLYVAVDNPVAINFYKALGFQHEGTMKNLFKRDGEDAYVGEYIMALMLDKSW